MTKNLKRLVKLDLSTDIDMLLMTGKSIAGVICHVIHQYAKDGIHKRL